MNLRISLDLDQRLEDEITDRLVEHNLDASELIRRRFEPDNLPSKPVAAYAIGDGGELPVSYTHLTLPTKRIV